MDRDEDDDPVLHASVRQSAIVHQFTHQFRNVTITPFGRYEVQCAARPSVRYLSRPALAKCLQGDSGITSKIRERSNTGLFPSNHVGILDRYFIHFFLFHFVS